jgi:hypothetical protein
MLVFVGGKSNQTKVDIYVAEFNLPHLIIALKAHLKFGNCVECPGQPQSHRGSNGTPTIDHL